MLLLSLIISFTLIWLCSGIVVGNVEKLAHMLRIPPFILSLFLLGTATSVPEISVAIQSIFLDTPQISLGTLIGGQMYILFGIIPILTLCIGKVRIQNPLQKRTVFLFLAVACLPLLLIFDQRISIIEGLLCVIAYAFFTLVFGTYLQREHRRMLTMKMNKRKGGQSILLLLTVAKILCSIAVIFYISGRLIGDITQIAELLGVHTFFISLFLVSFGTNIPELSIAVRSLFVKSKEIALGDYVGSATINTALIGLLATGRRGISIEMSPLPFVVFAIGAVVFWKFAQTKKELSRIEAVGLLSIYILFVAISSFFELQN